MSVWLQTTFPLRERPRGFHLVTDEITSQVPDLGKFKTGLMHVFIQHTSASLTINENADPDVRRDMEMAANRIVPETFPYVHTIEGPDDMPAHIKASLMGSSVSIPIGNGQLLLGTWQGIYLCEHRDNGGRRNIVVTVWGATG
jgi:secondary thiamine-phosphate synthase enzyme